MEFIEEVLQSGLVLGAHDQISTKVMSYLDSAAESLRSVLAALERLVQDCQRQGENESPPKAKRRKWIWKKGELQNLRNQVREAKGMLQLAFSAMAFLNQR